MFDQIDIFYMTCAKSSLVYGIHGNFSSCFVLLKTFFLPLAPLGYRADDNSHVDLTSCGC